MKSLKFQPHLVKLILSGSKKSTWRIFDDKGLSCGDKIELYENGVNKPFATAMITKVTEKQLGDLTEDDWIGHERFKNEEEMYATYRKYYGPEVCPDTVVKIISFELLQTLEPS